MREWLWANSGHSPANCSIDERYQPSRPPACSALCGQQSAVDWCSDVDVPGGRSDVSCSTLGTLPEARCSIMGNDLSVALQTACCSNTITPWTLPSNVGNATGTNSSNCTLHVSAFGEACNSLFEDLASNASDVTQFCDEATPCGASFKALTDCVDLDNVAGLVGEEGALGEEFTDTLRHVKGACSGGQAPPTQPPPICAPERLQPSSVAGFACIGHPDGDTAINSIYGHTEADCTDGNWYRYTCQQAEVFLPTFDQSTWHTALTAWKSNCCSD